MNNTLKHIAFIMDGNGRWAKQQNFERSQGHNQGAKQIPKIIDGCIENGIKHISFFAFSTENWKRPKYEINMLMQLLQSNFLDKNLEWFNVRKIHINVLGFETNLTKLFTQKLQKFCDQTKHNTDYIVNIFFNYGAQQEIVAACNMAVKLNKIQTLKSFEKFLFTKNQPAVDLLIRTSGEARLSNFLLWQSAYAEIIFEAAYWPAYDKEILQKNINEYYNRIRKFGGL